MGFNPPPANTSHLLTRAARAARPPLSSPPSPQVRVLDAHVQAEEEVLCPVLAKVRGRKAK